MKWQNSKRLILSLGFLGLFLIFFPNSTTAGVQAQNEDYDPMSLDWYYEADNFTIYDIAISADGNYIIAGGSNGTMNENFPYHGRILFFSKGSSTPIWMNTSTRIAYSVGISDNGGYAVVGDQNNRTYFFDTQSSAALHSFDTGYHRNIVEISGDGYYYACRSNDTIYFFNRTETEPMWTYDANAEVNAISLSRNGEYLVAGTEDGKVILFNNSDSTPVWTKDFGTEVFDVDISDKGETIVAGRENYTHVFSLGSAEPIWTDDLYDDDLNDDNVDVVSVSGNGNNIAVRCRNQKFGTTFYSSSSSEPVWYGGLNSYNELALPSKGNYFSASLDAPNPIILSNIDSSIFWEETLNAKYYIKNTDISSDGSKVIYHGGSTLSNTQYARLLLYTFTAPVDEEEKDNSSSDESPQLGVSFGLWFLLAASVAVVIILKRAKPNISK